MPQMEYWGAAGEYEHYPQGDPMMPQNPSSPPQLASISSMLDWNSHEYYNPNTPVNPSTPQPIPSGSPLQLDSGSVGNLTGSPTSSHLSYENGKCSNPNTLWSPF